MEDLHDIPESPSVSSNGRGGPRPLSTSTRDADPGREIAKLALENAGFQPGKMLEEVIRYAFDQLCWNRTTPELEAVVESLRSLMDEDS